MRTEIPCLPPVANPRRPMMPAPANACDTHFHIFGPAARFPYAADRAYTPQDAPLEDLLRLQDTLGVKRGVAVQGNAHGTDLSALLDALAREPRRLRGAAIVKDTVTDAELRRMADLGVKALRFHHMPNGVGFSSLGMAAFAKLAPRMKDFGFHVQFMMDADALDGALPFLKDWHAPIVIDHMGNVDASRGAEQPGVRQMCRLLAQGRIWVKVSGAYRISTRYPDYADAQPVHEALVAANPDQILWGTDWPHPRLDRDMPDDGHLLDLFNRWTPSDALRRRILADNPARLYGFA